MKDNAKVRKIAFVGDHLPRKCGIATFTSDLLAAVSAAHPESQCLSVSVNDIKGGYEYPEVVRFEIEEQDLPSYLRAADFLNISNVDVVCLQQEFGIFGGPAGGHILALLRELRMPVVTTLHTVLREPKADQRRVMEGLISLSTRLVVMAERGRQMLHGLYQAPLAKIDLIPHGIPDVGFVDPTYFKDQFGVEGKVVLLTFGLLFSRLRASHFSLARGSPGRFRPRPKRPGRDLLEEAGQRACRQQSESSGRLDDGQNGDPRSAAPL